MTRNLKVLAMALTALMALGAWAASSAAAAEFHSDATNTIITGEQTGNHVFDAAGHTITCEEAKFQGTQSGQTAADITATATYNKCKVKISIFQIAATVNMNNCAYTFSASGKAQVVNNGTKNCNESKITYNAEGFGIKCHVEVGTQTELGTITYDGSQTTSQDITVTPNVQGIVGTATGNGCEPAGQFTNGVYTSGPTTVKGFQDNSGVEGAQTAIWVA